MNEINAHHKPVTMHADFERSACVSLATVSALAARSEFTRRGGRFIGLGVPCSGRGACLRSRRSAPDASGFRWALLATHNLRLFSSITSRCALATAGRVKCFVCPHVAHLHDSDCCLFDSSIFLRTESAHSRIDLSAAIIA
jgi:hypothetical protein